MSKIALKTKIVNIDGREIRVKQLSFIGRVSLMRSKPSDDDLIRVSISEDDFKFLDNLPGDSLTVEQIKRFNEWYKNLIDAIYEVNSWNEEKSDGMVFQEKTQPESTSMTTNGTQNTGAPNTSDGLLNK